MKQFQIIYTDADAFRKELTELQQRCESNRTILHRPGKLHYSVLCRVGRYQA